MKVTLEVNREKKINLLHEFETFAVDILLKYEDKMYFKFSLIQC